jgi:hypothetical protein
LVCMRQMVTAAMYALSRYENHLTVATTMGERSLRKDLILILRLMNRSKIIRGAPPAARG